MSETLWTTIVNMYGTPGSFRLSATRKTASFLTHNRMPVRTVIAGQNISGEFALNDIVLLAGPKYTGLKDICAMGGVFIMNGFVNDYEGMRAPGLYPLAVLRIMEKGENQACTADVIDKVLGNLYRKYELPEEAVEAIEKSVKSAQENVFAVNVENGNWSMKPGLGLNAAMNASVSMHTVYVHSHSKQYIHNGFSYSALPTLWDAASFFCEYFASGGRAAPVSCVATKKYLFTFTVSHAARRAASEYKPFMDSVLAPEKLMAVFRGSLERRIPSYAGVLRACLTHEFTSTPEDCRLKPSEEIFEYALSTTLVRDLGIQIPYMEPHDRLLTLTRSKYKSLNILG